MRWLTGAIPLRVGLAAVVGLLSGALVFGLLVFVYIPPLIAAIVAITLTGVAVWIVSRSLSASLARLAASARGDRKFAVGGTREVEALGVSLRAMTEELESTRQAAGADRDRLASLLDELGESILIADETGRIERANRAAAEQFGTELIGRTLVEVIREHELLEAIGAARPDTDVVVQVERADPPRFQRAVARRLADRRLLLVIQELTAMRRLETVRKDFVANVSHELRTPLAALTAMVESLESGALDDREVARDFVRRMRQEVDGLAQLVEDLLILGRVESGQERFAFETTTAAELLGTAAERMRALVERAGVRLVVDPTRNVPSVAADRDRIGQVFANLLQNATRHTAPGGEIRLTATRDDEMVRFEVRDTGDGIAPHDLDRVFERFYKGDRSRATGGSGLGLSIAKHIVEAHGGSIRAASDGLGRGAAFSFTLPIASR